MASSSHPVSSSTAVILYQPSLIAHESLAREEYRRSWEAAKYETGRLNPEIPLADRRLDQFLPRPTGSYPVGHTHFDLVPGEEHAGDKEIGVEVFAAVTGDRKLPVLIFSHGYTTPPIKYRPLLEELASHGYTVLSLTHSSSVEEKHGLKLMEEIVYTEHLAGIMANNIQHVLDQVRDGELKDLGDPNKIVLAGHSVGGAASIMVSRINPAIVGCINLDGFLKGTNRTDGLAQPLLMITGDTNNYKRSFQEDLQHPKKDVRDYVETSIRSVEEYEILNRNSDHSEKMAIPGAGHMDFTDQPFRDYLTGDKTFSTAMRVHTIISQKMLEFLDSVCGEKIS